MLKINLSRQAHKFLKTRVPKQARQIAQKIVGLQENPNPADAKPLKGKSSLYMRADIGEYRIVYQVKKDTLKIAVVGKRNDRDVYKKLERKIRKK